MARSRSSGNIKNCCRCAAPELPNLFRGGGDFHRVKGVERRPRLKLHDCGRGQCAANAAEPGRVGGSLRSAVLALIAEGGTTAPQIGMRKVVNVILPGPGSLKHNVAGLRGNAQCLGVEDGPIRIVKDQHGLLVGRFVGPPPRDVHNNRIGRFGYPDQRTVIAERLRPWLSRHAIRDLLGKRRIESRGKKHRRYPPFLHRASGDWKTDYGTPVHDAAGWHRRAAEQVWERQKHPFGQIVPTIDWSDTIANRTKQTCSVLSAPIL